LKNSIFGKQIGFTNEITSRIKSRCQWAAKWYNAGGRRAVDWGELT